MTTLLEKRLRLKKATPFEILRGAMIININANKNRVPQVGDRIKVTNNGTFWICEVINRYGERGIQSTILETNGSGDSKGGRANFIWNGESTSTYETL